VNTRSDIGQAIIFYKDTDNRYLNANEAFARLVGVPLNEIVGKSAREILPHFADIYLFHDQDVIEHDYEKSNILEPIMTDQGIKWIRVNKIPRRDHTGTITGIAGFATDITDQMVRAAEKLRHYITVELDHNEGNNELHTHKTCMNPDAANQQQTESIYRGNEGEYRILYETALVGMFRTRIHDGKVMHANRACANLLGYPNTESLIQDGFIFSKYYADNRRTELIKKLIDLGQVYDFEARLSLPEGREIDVAISAKIYPDKGYLEGVIIDITERKRAEELLRKSIQEREMLLKEVHHRVKNNMQIISSMLRLHAMKTDDEKYQTFLMGSQNRIRSLALIHEMLYASDDLTRVDFHNYVSTLSHQMLRSSTANPNDVKIILNIKVATLGIDLAIPCALIINELLLNSLKHAFPDSRSGEITVEFDRSGAACYRLVVRDNGIGFPGDFDINATQSFGINLVKILTQQVRGTIKVDSHEGMSFTIIFPARI